MGRGRSVRVGLVGPPRMKGGERSHVISGVLCLLPSRRHHNITLPILPTYYPVFAFCVRAPAGCCRCALYCARRISVVPAGVPSRPGFATIVPLIIIFCMQRLYARFANFEQHISALQRCSAYFLPVGRAFTNCDAARLVRALQRLPFAACIFLPRGLSVSR